MTGTFSLASAGQPRQEEAGTVLESAGYRVLEADGGKEVIERVREYSGPIHVLLTDVVMPGVRGTDVARQVSSLLPGIRVLYMSAYTDTSVPELGPEASFIQKPFTPETLLARVRQALPDANSSAGLARSPAVPSEDDSKPRG